MTVNPEDFGLSPDAGKLPVPSGPLWKGPCDTSGSGGVTAELLTRFLHCPERTRLRYVEGLVPLPRLDHKKLFARLWNVAVNEFRSSGLIGSALDAAYEACDHVQDLFLGPEDREKCVHWFNVLVPTFTTYVKYRQENPIDQGSPISLRLLPWISDTVSCEYTLPSGRVVNLRGIEGVSWQTNVGTPVRYRLERRVVKGDLSPDRLLNTARLDLDTMFMVVLHGGRIAEVYYDMVRRPLSGGKGNISRHKATSKNPSGESGTAFYARLRDTVLDADPAYWYPHALVEIQSSDVSQFRINCLDPLLERLCDWYEWYDPNGPHGAVSDKHYIAPFTFDCAATEYDDYLLTGSEKWLTRSKVVFPELEETY